MNTLDLLDRPIAFHRIFVTITGSVNAALMLSQAIYWSKRTNDPEGWFYKTQKDWQEETGISRHELGTARKLLAAVLEEKLAGMPATVHYRVSAEKLKTWLSESGKQDCRKTANWSAGKRQPTNKAETTAETTSLPPGGGKGELSKAICSTQLNLVYAIFHKKPSTALDKSEQKAWDDLTAKGKRPLDEADLDLVARYYKKHWPPKRDRNVLRHSMATFMNNFSGEVTKARGELERVKRPEARAREEEIAPVTMVPSGPIQRDSPEGKLFTDFFRKHQRYPAGYVERDGIFVSSNGAHL